MRELMARVVRDAIGRVMCVISDYSVAVLAEARRLKAMVIADRPDKATEQALRQAKAAGEIAGLIVVDTAGDAVPPYAGAPVRPRRHILANGEHSSKEAIAFDLHVRGHDFSQIGALLNVDGETAKTFVRRAERKNKAAPGTDDVLRRLELTDGEG